MSPITLGSLSLKSHVFNSSCPWASTEEQLRNLFQCKATGAVTTRTATIDGFKETRGVHEHVFTEISSLNSYGYSPFPLSYYIKAVSDIAAEDSSSSKPFIISITSSSPTELLEMLHLVLTLYQAYPSRIAIEINTSCPNIPNHPPPAYDPVALLTLLQPLLDALPSGLTLGIKLPPFTHIGQFTSIIQFLEAVEPFEDGSPKIAYLACTNTLGGAVVFDEQVVDGSEGRHIVVKGEEGFALDGGFGGLAGPAIHAVSVGNVARFSLLLKASSSDSVKNTAIVGIGGASDRVSVGRFLKAGAKAVACATALGRRGMVCFDEMI